VAIPFIPIISAVAGFFGKKQDHELLKTQGKQKLAQGKELNKAEWEALGVQGGQGSWKDEFITVIVTLPIPYIFVGNTVYAFTGNSKILEANKAALADLGLLMDTPYGQLIMVVCVAAIGIKWTKGMFAK